MSLINIRNRLGFGVLGLTNNFAYVIMLAAANDLLKAAEKVETNPFTPGSNYTSTNEPYCNVHSTSTILLANTIPSLATKILYPLLLVGIPFGYKALATALLSAASFSIVGLNSQLTFVFIGVVCASLSSGLGESTFLSNTPVFGDVSLSGWSIGTGAAGLVGAGVYAVLAGILSTKVIMLIMLIVPVAMMASFWFIIIPTNHQCVEANHQSAPCDEPSLRLSRRPSDQSNIDNNEHKPIDATLSNHENDTKRVKRYGVSHEPTDSRDSLASNNEKFDFGAKISFLPSLKKYFLPLLLVYFGEYFINQGLFELIYIKSFTPLDKNSQYRWFQVFYQLGVLISRSSIELFRIKNIWIMSILQLVNALIFLGHVSLLYQIPSIYIVIALIIYEGLLGGFTYVNTFFRIKKEIDLHKQEFAISAVTMADSLGIVVSGLVAIPVHNALCKLYK